MNNYKFNAQIVYDGKYKLINIDQIIDSFNEKKVSEIIKKIKPALLMTELVRKKFKVNSSFDRNLCGDCVNMLHCPKVMDKEKKSLKHYPYITDGLEILLINEEIRKQYLYALEEYKKRSSDYDSYIDDDEDLNLRLADSGIDVPVISVFKCKKFVAEQQVVPRLNYKK